MRVSHNPRCLVNGEPNDVFYEPDTTFRGESFLNDTITQTSNSSPELIRPLRYTTIKYVMVRNHCLNDLLLATSQAKLDDAESINNGLRKQIAMLKTRLDQLENENDFKRNELDVVRKESEKAKQNVRLCRFAKFVLPPTFISVVSLPVQGLLDKPAAK